MIRCRVNVVIVGAGLAITFPLMALAARVRPAAGRAVAQRAARMIAGMCGIRIVVDGPPPSAGGRATVLVANHSSPIDIPALLVAQPDVRFVASAELFDVPLLGLALRALQSLPVDRRDARAAREQLADISGALDSPVELAVFAGGGIAPLGEVLPFKTGAFVIAIEAGATVIPVAIHGAAAVLAPRDRFAVRPGTIVVRRLAPIPTEGLVLRDRKKIRDDAFAAVAADLAGTPG